MGAIEPFKKVALLFVLVTKLVTMQAISSFFLQVKWMWYESGIFFNRAGENPCPFQWCQLSHFWRETYTFLPHLPLSRFGT